MDSSRRNKQKKKAKQIEDRITAYRRADKLLWVAELVGVGLVLAVGGKNMEKVFFAACAVLSPLAAWKSVLYHRLPPKMRNEIFDRAICSRHEHLPYAEFLLFTVLALIGAVRFQTKIR